MANSHDRRKLRRATGLPTLDPIPISRELPTPAVPNVEKSISMRALIPAAMGVLVNLGVDLWVAKYGTTVPDSLIVGLWILPLFPFGWWAYTHPGLARYRSWFEIKLEQRPIYTGVALAVLLFCLGGIGHGVWLKLARPRSSGTQATPVTSSVVAPISPPIKQAVQESQPQDSLASNVPKELPHAQYPGHTTAEQRDAIRHDLETKWLALHPDAPPMVKQHKEWTKEEINWVNDQLKKRGENFRLVISHRQPPALFKADHDSTIEIDNAVITGNFDELVSVDHGSKATVGKGAVINRTKDPPAPK
jgi:hypothetical protein